MTNVSNIEQFKTAMGYYGRFFIGSTFLLLLAACSKDASALNKPEWEGPTMRLDSVNTMMTDSAELLVRIISPREEAYANGDREWKKGLFLQYYNDDGQVTTTFKSDYAFYDREKHLYKGVGHVVVQNLINKDELNTEELFWDPNEKRFFTDRYVTIRTTNEVHTGEGLTANEDFTYYKIIDPAGSFPLEQDSDKPSE